VSHSSPVRSGDSGSGPAIQAGRAPVCLIVEDVALIGMALESYLEDQGFDCVAVCSSGEALAWLETRSPSVAILDYMLEDGPCTPLVSALRARRVPFLVYSGFPAPPASSELGEVRWIGKPADRAALLGAIAQLVSASQDLQRV
jgi:DNA-binding response OmpR family regulator